MRIKEIKFKPIGELSNELSSIVNIGKDLSIIISFILGIGFFLYNIIKSPQLYLDYHIDGNYVAEFTAEDLQNPNLSTAKLNERNLYYDHKDNQMYYYDNELNIAEGSSINYNNYIKKNYNISKSEDGLTYYTNTQLMIGDYTKKHKKPYITLVSDPVSYIVKSDTDINKTHERTIAYRPNTGSKIIFQLRNDKKWNSTVANDVKINIKFNSIELDLRSENITEIDGKKYFDDKWLIKDDSTLEYTFDNYIVPINGSVDNSKNLNNNTNKYRNDYGTDSSNIPDYKMGSNTRMYKYNEKVSLDLSQATGIISVDNGNLPTMDITLIYGDKTKSYSIDIEYESCPCYYENSTCHDAIIENKTNIDIIGSENLLKYENLESSSMNILIADIAYNPFHKKIIDEYINIVDAYNYDNKNLLRKYNTEIKRKSQKYIKEQDEIEEKIEDKYNDLENIIFSTIIYYKIKGYLSKLYDIDEKLYNKLIITLENEIDIIKEKFLKSGIESINYILNKYGYKMEDIEKLYKNAI